MKDERSRKLYDGITNVDDELVEAAQAKAAPRSRPWAKWAALAACLCLVIAAAIALWPGRAATRPQAPQPGRQEEPGQHQGEPAYTQEPVANFLVSKAVYPEMVPYPGEFASDEEYDAWQTSVNAQKSQPSGYKDGLDGFFADSTAQFLSGAGTENRVYSPLNVYMALALLAETTDGDSRQQILDLLGADSIESLRKQANAVWHASYRDDGIVTTRLANSLWLRDDMAYNQDTADTLARKYYASTFRGEMGSDAYTEALRSWLSEQTGGLLDGYISDLKLSPETVLALASTIYYKAGWDDEFFAGVTSSDVFHTPDGDVERDFMHQTRTGFVYRGEGFTAVSKHMRESGWMWLILPDEGTDMNTVLAGNMMPLLLGDGDSVSQNYYNIHLSLPKFDVSSRMDLAADLRALGVTDVFDGSAADFSPITDARGVFVGKVEHAARVTVDEEGVEAAAYTVIEAPGAAPGEPELPEDYYFTLDRPFLFAITGADGLPLFVGVVNQP